MDVQAYVAIVAVLAIPGLLLLPLAMAWLETHLTTRMVADDVATAWVTVRAPDELVAVISSSTAGLFPVRH